MTFLEKIKIEKIAAKSGKRAKRNRNANKITILLRRSNYATMFLLWNTAASATHSSYLQHNLKV